MPAQQIARNQLVALAAGLYFGAGLLV